MAPPAVALLGLGEAGTAIAADLAHAGTSVRGFDPAGGADVAGVERAADARAAVAAAVVLSVNAASVAARGRRRRGRRARARHVYADLNTCAPRSSARSPP